MLNKLCKYPTKVLPRYYYKRRMDIASMLLAYPGLMAVRLVVGDEQDFVINTNEGQLEISDNIFKGNITNLSMNLAGGLFDTSRCAHLRFLPSSEKAKQTWNGGYISPKFYISNNFYKESPNCFGVCIPVSLVHDITFPFVKKFSSEKELNDFLSERGVNASDSDSQYCKRLILAFDRNIRTATVPYRLKINHIPTMANYWHVTLDSYRPEDAGLKIVQGGKESSADRKMQKALKNHIKQICKIDKNPEYTIESRFYTKADSMSSIICLSIKVLCTQMRKTLAGVKAAQDSGREK